jgi:hypothetical protein
MKNNANLYTKTKLIDTLQWEDGETYSTLYAGSGTLCEIHQLSFDQGFEIAFTPECIEGRTVNYEKMSEAKEEAEDIMLEFCNELVSTTLSSFPAVSSMLNDTKKVVARHAKNTDLYRLMELRDALNEKIQSLLADRA